MYTTKIAHPHIFVKTTCLNVDLLKIGQVFCLSAINLLIDRLWQIADTWVTCSYNSLIKSISCSWYWVVKNMEFFFLPELSHITVCSYWVGIPYTVFYLLVISDEIFHVMFLPLCCMNKIYLELQHIPSTRFLMNYVTSLMYHLIKSWYSNKTVYESHIGSYDFRKNDTQNVKRVVFLKL